MSIATVGRYARRHWTRFSLIFSECDTHPVEVMSAMVQIAIGIMLVLPHKTFEHQSYGSLSHIAPEWVWATGLLLHGVTHLFAVVRTCHIRRDATLTAFMIFLAWTMLFGWKNPWFPGFPMFVVMTLAQLWVYMRLPAGKARVPEAKHAE
jgi:hypothetical protein